MLSAVLAIVNPSVCPSVRQSLALCQNDSSYDHGVFTVDSPMTLVSSWLTSARNSKGNLGSEGAE